MVTKEVVDECTSQDIAEVMLLLKKMKEEIIAREGPDALDIAEAEIVL